MYGKWSKDLQDLRPTKWNEHVFHQLIPHAWARLISIVCEEQPYMALNLLPSISAEDDLWHDSLFDLTKYASSHKLPIFYSDVGCVHHTKAFFADQQCDVDLRQALKEARIPVVCLPSDKLSIVSAVPHSRMLSGKTLRDELVNHGALAEVSEKSRLAILKFLVHHLALSDVSSLPLFPFEDSAFRSLSPQGVFMHRNAVEKSLFSLQTKKNLDTSQLSPSMLEKLSPGKTQGKNLIRYRTLHDFRDFVLDCITATSQDSVQLSSTLSQTIAPCWRWLQEHMGADLSPSILGDLCLVPIGNRKFRRIIPQNRSNAIAVFFTSELRSVAMELLSLDPADDGNRFLSDSIDHGVMKRLLGGANKNPAYAMYDGETLPGFLTFAKSVKASTSRMSSNLTKRIWTVLRNLASSSDVELKTWETQVLRDLPVFPSISWTKDLTPPTYSSRSLGNSTETKIVGLTSLIPLPTLGSLIFLDATNQRDRNVLQNFASVSCYNEDQILGELIIPSMCQDHYTGFSSEVRLSLAKHVLQNLHRISSQHRSQLRCAPFVPLRSAAGLKEKNFQAPSSIIHPSSHGLMDLFPEDEAPLPDPAFFEVFKIALEQCGLISTLSCDLIAERVRDFVSDRLTQELRAEKSQKMLLLGVESTLTASQKLQKLVRNAKWLPALNLSRNLEFVSPEKCRDITHRPLVSEVWNTLPFTVNSSWFRLLGWEAPIDTETLLQQLSRTVDAGNEKPVDAILKELKGRDMGSQQMEKMRDISFLRSTDTAFAFPASCCENGAHDLAPFLHNVEPRFFRKHQQILNDINIPKNPTLHQLQQVQNALCELSHLNDRDISVSIALANAWSGSFPDSVGLLYAPDAGGVMCPLRDLAYNDMPWTKLERPLAHPGINIVLAERLRIEPVSELIKKGELGISDLDDEFVQREETTDGIRDSLIRYTRESTFHEYIANADDTQKATQVSFLVDDSTYPKGKLITKRLGECQGPALLIYNDATFTEKDYEGLKYVGRGSKRQNPGTIGKFGRGSQTMFHWTDSPMILSGASLVILDPLQTRLPRNFLKGQNMPGIKVEWAKLRDTFSDQLTPFEGLWGFDSSKDYYSGTIFRFALRGPSAKSDLLEFGHSPSVSDSIHLFRKMLNEARLTLLFLRNIDSVQFGVRKDPDFDWRVRRGLWPDETEFSGRAEIFVHRPLLLSDNKGRTDTETWWRVIADVQDGPAELQIRHKSTMKNIEVGIAGLLKTSNETVLDSSKLSRLPGRLFNCTPLKFDSGLPVHVQGTFLLSGDRQNIAIEDTSRDAGSGWNCWLLRDKIPRVYLQFLEEVARVRGKEVYRFFPQASGEQQSLSNLIRENFWNQISKDRTLRLFPITEPPTLGESTSTRQIRKAPTVTDATNAIFDVLDGKKSEVLRPLLATKLKALVSPPFVVARQLKRSPVFRSVTPSLVRALIRSGQDLSSFYLFLEENPGKAPVFLDYILPETENELHELHECRVLPLKNGKFGTLYLAEKAGSASEQYLAAPKEVHNLFDFAASYFSDDRPTNRSFTDQVLSSGQFNLKLFDPFNDLQAVLGPKNWTPGKMSEDWFKAFWNYMNQREPKNLDFVHDLPLFLVSKGPYEDSQSSRSLEYIDGNAVMWPSEQVADNTLYASFSGLEVVHHATVPLPILQSEKSLACRPSINRLLRSLQILAVQASQSITDYVRGRLGPEQIEVCYHCICICI